MYLDTLQKKPVLIKIFLIQHRAAGTQSTFRLRAEPSWPVAA